MVKNKNQAVYLFRHKGTDFVKIGMTTKNDCQDRFMAFCTYSPYGGEIVGVIKTNNSKELESKLHKKYSHKRINGEFFLLTQEECDSILNNNNVKYYEDVLNLLKLIDSELDVESMYKVKLLCKDLLFNIGFDKDKNKDSIIECFTTSSDYKYTVSELSNLLLKTYNIDCHPNSLGLKLSRFFQKKKVKKDGKVILLYKCELLKLQGCEV